MYVHIAFVKFCFTTFVTHNVLTYLFLNTKYCFALQNLLFPWLLDTRINFLFLIFFPSRCQVCMDCILSSAVQPPCTICRRCGQSNLQVLVPDKFPFGEWRFMGLESTHHTGNIFFHLNDRILHNGIAVATTAPACPAMLVLGRKRKLLGFDPENAENVAAVERQHPQKFQQPFYSEFGLLSKQQVADILPQIFHCAATKYAFSTAQPKLSYVHQGKPVYTSDRPSLAHDVAPASLPSSPAPADDANLPPAPTAEAPPTAPSSPAPALPQNPFPEGHTRHRRAAGAAAALANIQAAQAAQTASTPANPQPVEPSATAASTATATAATGARPKTPQSVTRPRPVRFGSRDIREREVARAASVPTTLSASRDNLPSSPAPSSVEDSSKTASGRAKKPTRSNCC